MQIFIRGISLQKYCNVQTINNIKKTDSTRTLYTMINNMFTVTEDYYYLYQGNNIFPVSDEKKLEDYNIGNESTINIHFRLGSPINIAT
jgi:hypothetical protein|tara:strand:- start:315 stop:581 length:267 start_codon:yes stop_codon:yes gene_type:complete